MSFDPNKGAGTTATEAILARLADHTFLNLWSWPNVHKEPGKELCDLLVVCDDDVVIFSDKNIKWPGGCLEVAWARWYRRAVAKSVEQIRGATRWLQDNPEEIYSDARCRHRLPLELPPPNRRRIHGICVAMGAERAASSYFEDPDGTFFLLPHLKGDSHTDFHSDRHRPFAIGDVDPHGPFVHVFNQLTLSVVMRELDTVTDFTTYLTAREKLIRSGRLICSPSEMEMLSTYLRYKHKFPTPKEIGASEDTMIGFSQGDYVNLVNSPEYENRHAANKVSYAWDQLIELFAKHALQGTSAQILDIAPNIHLAERALRIMAKENRLNRRFLGQALSEALSGLEAQKKDRFGRIVLPRTDSADPHLAYVFMVLSSQKWPDQETYRKARSSMLETYCLAALFDHRELQRCVGVGVNALSDKDASEDLLAVDQPNWTTEMVEALGRARANYEIMCDPRKLSRRSISIQEFPTHPASAHLTRQQRRALERAHKKEARRDL